MISITNVVVFYVSTAGVKDTNLTLFLGVDFHLLEVGVILMPGRK